MYGKQREQSTRRIGASVFGIWLQPGGSGTIGAHGTVVDCRLRPDGDWTLTADLGGQPRTYHLSRNGHSDYVGKPLNQAPGAPASTAARTPPAVSAAVRAAAQDFKRNHNKLACKTHQVTYMYQT